MDSLDHIVNRTIHNPSYQTQSENKEHCYLSSPAKLRDCYVNCDSHLNNSLMLKEN